MLEIIYDARLIQLPTDGSLKFFGAKPSQWGSSFSFNDFSHVHQLVDGGRAVEYGPLIGHYHSGTPNGTPNQAGHGRIEFIVPVNADSTPYIEKLAEADGIYLQGNFFETLSTFSTGPNQHVEQGRFRIPPNHFYFLGEHTNVV